MPQLSAELGSARWTRGLTRRSTREQKAAFVKLTPEVVRTRELAGDPIYEPDDPGSGNDAPLGGLKVSTANGWFAARPLGTENLYKLYAESFRFPEAHLQALVGGGARVGQSGPGGMRYSEFFKQHTPR